MQYDNPLLKFQPKSTLLSSWCVALGLIVTLVSLLFALPQHIFIPGSPTFIATLGLIALWRYLWGALHMVRALLYRLWVWPAIRRSADTCTKKPRHLTVVVLSYRIAPEVNSLVYRNLFDEAARFGVPVRIVASVASRAEKDLIERMMAEHPYRRKVELIILLQDGTGKRSAIASALEHIRNLGCPRESVTILMDGDTLLSAGTFSKTASVLMDDAQVGALTTENIPLVAGASYHREWYRLRMTQRHMYMCSQALSSRVLVLTGRFSVFRSEIAYHKNFAAMLNHDALHTGQGKVKMLTGEDKSSWRWVVERGYKLLYVPDTPIYSLEELPGKGFFRSTTSLMLRWFGNMIRGGARALRVDRQKVGFFAYLTFLDQRVSKWTTLVAPVFFSLAALLHDVRFLFIYLLWLIVSRTLYTLMLGLVAGRWNPWFVPLLVYTQIWGSWLKIRVSFNPGKQAWTRQGISIGGDSWLSTLSWLASLLFFVFLVAWLSGVHLPAQRFIL